MAAPTALTTIAAPLRFGLRRLRVRPYSTAALVAALAAAGGLIGWSSLGAALAQEKSVRSHLEALPPKYRSIHVRYYTLPLEGDFRAGAVDGAFRQFSSVTGPVARVQIWHSLDPNDPNGKRLAVAGPGDLRLAQGRPPRGCRDRTCEAVTLSGRARIGDRVALGQGRVALIVGRGSLRPAALPDRTELGRETLLVESLARPLRPLVREVGSTVVDSAVLDPAKVRAFELGALTDRLRRQTIRLERGDPLVRVTAPVATLERLRERGTVARHRLLLVAGQAAALLIAFTTFVAAGRRRETELLESQLLTLGASRRQTWLARIVEALVPSLAAVSVSLIGLLVASILFANARGLPLAFVGAALPRLTLLAVVGIGAVSCGLLVAAGTPPRRPRLGFGTLELTALVALAVLVWQAATTGALDPDRVAGGGGPLILLVPALGFFAAGVIMLRLMPPVLRASERVARYAPVTTRVAFLTAARSPAQTAAATTFLAIAVGSALFSLDYRATLERQGRDQARFAAGAAWRVVGRGQARSQDVTPLTRFAAVSSERPTPAARLSADLTQGNAQVPVTVLALPAAQLTHLLGWRRDFSSLPPAEIAHRLRPRAVSLRGPRLEGDAVRVWARSITDYPRVVVLHLLRRGQDFAHVRLGVAGRRWRRLTVALPSGLRGSQLVGLEYAPTYVPIDFKYDPKGFVDLGRIEQRRDGVWSTLPSLERWTQTTSQNGTAGILISSRIRGGPVTRSLRFVLNGTFQPLIHPHLGLPAPAPGFENGPIRVLAGPAVAAQAVDKLVTLALPGKAIEARVVVTANLFPSIVARRSAFVVVDYDTLFAAMNADRPGLLAPSEAWFFDRQRPGFAAAVDAPSFRVERVVSEQALETQTLGDPLAAGTRSMLTVTAVLAAALALIGLVLAARSTIAAERLQLAEYEALGVPRSALRRSAQLRLIVLSLLGLAAGVIGGGVSARITGAFVAVTGAGTRPLPPIATVVAWTVSAALVVAAGVAGAVSASLVARRALREPAAQRLRA
jgi:hypothetical protein